MSDVVFYPLMLMLIAAVVAAALLWPVGIGVREPAAIYALLPGVGS